MFDAFPGCTNWVGFFLGEGLGATSAGYGENAGSWLKNHVNVLFKSHDIHGRVPDELNEEFAYRLGCQVDNAMVEKHCSGQEEGK